VIGWWRCRSFDLRGLLEQERRLVAVSAAARTRALARARAALAAPPAAPAPSAWAPRRPRSSRWLAAAGVAFIAGAASGVAAYELELRARPIPTSVGQTERRPPATSDETPAAGAIRVPLARPAALTGRSPARADAARAELRLLEQARAAVLREDFAGALTPLAEHARRFKNGRLTEEREALRVKALAGLGRDREAERAAAAFEARFPRSPLVGAVNRIAESGF
jgi:hypothetical protein